MLYFEPQTSFDNSHHEFRETQLSRQSNRKSRDILNTI